MIASTDSRGVRIIMVIEDPLVGLTTIHGWYGGQGDACEHEVYPSEIHKGRWSKLLSPWACIKPLFVAPRSPNPRIISPWVVECRPSFSIFNLSISSPHRLSKIYEPNWCQFCPGRSLHHHHHHQSEGTGIWQPSRAEHLPRIVVLVGLVSDG